MLDEHLWPWGHYRYIDASEKDNSRNFYRWDKLLTSEKSSNAELRDFQRPEKGAAWFVNF